jgi:hypothetical protein
MVPSSLATTKVERLLCMEGGDLAWQMERLLPIAVAHLPPECEAVVLIDP